MPFPIACSSITWGSFRKADPQKWTEEAILQAIADAGYKSAQAGMWSGRTAQQTLALYGRFGLRPAPGYMSAEFWNPEAQPKILEQAQRQADFARGIGCTQVYVADGFSGLTPGGKKRSQVAAHSGPEDEMTADQYKQFAECLNQVGRITLAAGVQTCFHNHVGTFVETRTEIDHLMALTDPAVVFLGPDTGHLAWAGADAAAFCQDYASRIKTIHLKDINPQIVAQGRREKWDYNAFSAHGVFIEFGEGCVDFPTVFKCLDQAGMTGPAIVEIDITPKPSPVECITLCREYLKKIGYWRS
jgi:inosose dehydratase